MPQSEAPVSAPQIFNWTRTIWEEMVTRAWHKEGEVYRDPTRRRSKKRLTMAADEFNDSVPHCSLIRLGRIHNSCWILAPSRWKRIGSEDRAAEGFWLSFDHRRKPDTFNCSNLLPYINAVRVSHHVLCWEVEEEWKKKKISWRKNGLFSFVPWYVHNVCICCFMQPSKSSKCTPQVRGKAWLMPSHFAFDVAVRLVSPSRCTQKQKDFVFVLGGSDQDGSGRKSWIPSWPTILRLFGARMQLRQHVLSTHNEVWQKVVAPSNSLQKLFGKAWLAGGNYLRSINEPKKTKNLKQLPTRKTIHVQQKGIDFKI